MFEKLYDISTKYDADVVKLLKTYTDLAVEDIENNKKEVYNKLV